MPNLQLLLIRGAIEELPDDQKADVKACAERLRQVIADAGDSGTIALALIGAELSDA